VTKIICGVDVSSRSLHVRIGCDGPDCSFPNTTTGIAALAAFCRQHNVELVALEATGGYEKQPFAHCGSTHGSIESVVGECAGQRDMGDALVVYPGDAAAGKILI
jgi:hypothetical protein